MIRQYEDIHVVIHDPPHLARIELDSGACFVGTLTQCDHYVEGNLGFFKRHVICRLVPIAMVEDSKVTMDLTDAQLTFELGSFPGADAGAE